MSNLLRNGSFEGGWHHPGGLPELQIPNDWSFWHAGSEVQNPHSSDTWNRFVRPEVRVLPSLQLPEQERELFILDGNQTLKIFKGNGAWFGRLSQTLQLERGTYTLTVKMYADLIKGYDNHGRKIWADDPQGRDGLLRFKLNDHTYDFKSLRPGEWNTFTQEFAADAETKVAVEVMCPFALTNCGVFADGWALEQVAVPIPSGRGAPREQYARTVNVLPAEATLEQAATVFKEAWQRGREAVSGSYDDAGIGDLDVRRAHLYGIPPGKQQEYRDFYHQYYPGVAVTFKPLPTEEPKVDEPPTDDTTISAGVTGSKIGVHAIVANRVAAFQEQLVGAGTHFAVVKAVDDLNWLSDVKALSPDTKIIARLTSPDEGVTPVNNPGVDLDKLARRVMRVIFDRLNAAPELADVVDYWEPVNEPLGGGVPTDAYVRLAELMKRCMLLAEGRGLKLALFAFNAGTPEWPDMVGMAQTGVFGQARDGGHSVAFHEGVFGDDAVDKWFGGGIPGAPQVEGAGALCCRYRFLAHLLKQRGELVPFVISEFYAGGGYEQGADRDDVLRRFRWYDEQVRADDYVMGFCPFTLGPVGQWRSHDYEFMYPRLLEYIQEEAG
jgi:hypothetical protein